MLSAKKLSWKNRLFHLFASGILFFAGLFSCAKAPNAPGGPEDLRCEYQTDPLGIDVLQPRLSWLVNDSRRGAVQSAYQILVASSEQKLRQDTGDIWDSGKVLSGQSVHVPYAGSDLQSGKRYFWKVRTWDGAEQPSPYSQSAWWEMGLLHRSDWRAEWIGKKLPPEKPKIVNWRWGDWIWNATENGKDKPIYFRKKFDLPALKKVRSAQIKTTADNYFTAFLNGEKVGEGAVWTKMFSFDVKSVLKPGTNIIAATAANNSGEICGFLFSLKIAFEDGSMLYINSDKTWKNSARKFPHWQDTDFDDGSWQKAHVIEAYGGPQWGKIEKEETYLPPRSILVRKEYTIGKKISAARAYVTGLGSYILRVNGRRIGNDIFTPGWTDYPTRIQYQTYDVTPFLKQGENAIGAILGNMWWSSGLGWRGSQVYSKGPLRFFMQLIITFADGSSDTLVTDENWRTQDSPILENSIYHGETYDARLETAGWDEPGFDDSTWEPVIKTAQKKVKMVAQQGPTIQITQEIHPVNITEPDSGVYIFDMGQNMVGWVQLKVKGKAGTKVVLRFAEILKKDGNIYTENLRSARATDTYILRGGGSETWQPHFTYHGFRYVEVKGFPDVPGKDAITGKVIHSAAPEIGRFACSNELLNRIQHNIVWGQRGNMESVPTDCPQRDERLGWMGDAQTFSPTASYNMNMARFFAKWMHDIIDCQDADGAVHDVSPTIVVGGPAKPAWGDAVVIVPWMMYRFYGDKRIITENYDGMAAWVNFMKNKSKGFLYEQSGYGDWVAPVESPKKPIGSAYFYYSTKLLSKMAAIIGKEADAFIYEKLAEKIAEAYNRKHLDKNNHEYEGATQTANLLPLAFGITPPNLKDQVVANVVKDVKKRGNHLSTGFLGTGYLLPVLSENGFHELAYQVASQTTYPSWGYMVEKGATTIWELWNSDSQGPGMNSRNHFALGSIGEWFYGFLAGIRPDPSTPGFKRAVIAPLPAGDLTWAEGSMKTVYGKISTRWENRADQFILNLSLPANTSAIVFVPKSGKENVIIEESGRIIFPAGKAAPGVTEIKYNRSEKDAVVFDVGAGVYKFTVMSE